MQTTAIASGNFSSSPSTPRKQKKACYTRSSPSSTRPARALDSPLVVLYTGRRAVAQRLQRERERKREPTRERFAMCLPFGKRTSRPLLTRRARTQYSHVCAYALVCVQRVGVLFRSEFSPLPLLLPLLLNSSDMPGCARFRCVFRALLICKWLFRGCFFNLFSGSRVPARSSDDFTSVAFGVMEILLRCCCSV